MSEPTIAKIIPEKYAVCEQALSGDNGLNDARACLALLAKARAALERSSVDGNNPDQQNINAYCAAWGLCIQTMQNSNDEAGRPCDGFDKPFDSAQGKLTADCAGSTTLTTGQGRQLIIDAWNKSLQEDSDLTPLQIYTLSEQWDRELLTDEFWQLLSQTDNKQTAFAICCVLYERGNADDIRRLMQSANPALVWDFRKSLAGQAYRTQMVG